MLQALIGAELDRGSLRITPAGRDDLHEVSARLVEHAGAVVSMLGAKKARHGRQPDVPEGTCARGAVENDEILRPGRRNVASSASLGRDRNSTYDERGTPEAR